ncbi:hypothetical protein L596_004026 [Steinernema carpocapsae]|uniref:Uncharacterized protein n=1 Tax=Steinernema carpocapsae TaxID=34508 RepID=A0A4U8UVI2_STECR|nr:hypothetical protein L596_004026 [Steinernema carpocapsae]
MVGSQGFRRQDIVFGLSCRPINELYPWWGIPQGIAELEREDCRYSTMFDPIVDTSGNYSCGPREYLAGISRIADTRVQLECCRMRTRDEKNCVERKFAKPFGNDPRTEIEHQGKLINSIKTEHHTFKVRFCDLVPRAVEMIFEDVPPTTTSRLTTTQPLPPTTPFIQDNIMQENKLLPEQSINEASQTDEAQLVSNRKVIRVFRPSSLVSSGAGQWSTAEPTLANQIEVTSSSTTSEQPEIIEPIDRKEEEVALPDEVQFAGIEPKQRLPAPEVHGNSAFDHSLTEAQKIAHKIIARVKSGEGIESEQMAEQLVKEIESQNDPKAADELFKQSIATLNEYVDDKNMTEQDEDVLDVDSTVDMVSSNLRYPNSFAFSPISIFEFCLYFVTCSASLTPGLPCPTE